MTATWTGEAGDGDFANAGNWCCSNDLGEVKGVLPNALTAVTIPGELVMDIPVGAPLECKSIAVAGPFANDCDWSGLGSTIAGAGTIDLKGHKLTLTDLVGNYGITDSSEEGSTPGELHIKVEKGKTIQNTTVAFSGSLKIVKEGEGILELGAILQTNVGGWEIAEGTVKAIASPYSKTSTFFGKTGSTVVVREGATYDLNKQYDTRYYPFILDGGTIANRGGDEPASSGSMGPITLTKNSNFDVTYSFPLWGKVDLGGLTLTVNIADDKSLYLHKDGSQVGGTFENGTVIVTGGGYFAPNAASGTSRDMRTVDFRFEGPLAQTTSIDVRNLTMIYDDTKKSGSGKVNIYGTFTPSANNYLNNFVMQDGSTLNLVGREGIYDTSSTLTSQTLGFGDNATILIDVGERKLETDEKVVAWSAKPANVGGLTFKFIGKNLDYESVNAVVMDDGIYYPDVTTIVKATWTGDAGDGNLANPANWSCENALGGKVIGDDALPGESTVVYLNGEIAFNVTNGATFTAGSVNANASLKGDTDWSGLNPSIPVSGTIDLKGHKLTVANLVGNYEITDSSEDDVAPGEFHINVASGSVKNTAVTFTGTTRVVKEGEGTLELGTIKQSNAGGWEIAEGTVKASVNLAENTSFGQLGATVVVREGATYDLNGQCDTRRYPFVLDGGTIANTGSGVNAIYGCMGPITLTKDSKLDVYSPFPLWGKVDLGGFTLTVDIRTSQRLYLYGDGIFENGTVDIITGGLFDSNGPAGTLRDMRTVDFKLNADLALTSSINVRDLTSIYDDDWREGTGSVNIYGVFTPSAKNYIHNFVMQDGSTLNLAGRASIYDVTSTSASKVRTGISNVLGFADGATITVDPGERIGKIISWTAETKPADTVNFVLPVTAVGKLEARDDGLYRHTALAIILR